ncbi:MAG: hypothetical protein MJ082_01600 [Clostridia bacterium]|nr:hypothetical protein [Clostridia bacterium]
MEDESSIRDLMVYTLKVVRRTHDKGGGTNEDFKQTFNTYKQRDLSV